MDKAFFDNKLGKTANITYKDVSANSFVVGVIRSVSLKCVGLDTKKGEVLISYDSMVAVQIINGDESS